MSDTRYLKQRHRTWYVRVRVPPSLKHVLGSELSRTTRTRDLRVARQLRWRIVAEMKQKIAEAESSKVLGERDAGWVLTEAKRLARDVRDGTTDQELALEVGLSDILTRHFKAAEYATDPATGYPVINSKSAQASIEAASNIVSAGASMMMSDAVDTYLAEIEDRVIKTTWLAKRRMIGGLQRYLGDIELSKVTKLSCGDYLTTQLMPAGRAVKTTRNILTHLSAFFTWSEGRGLIDRNPIAGLSSTVHGPTRAARRARRPWHVEELEILFRAYDSTLPIWQLSAIGLYSGLRIEEICTIRCCDVTDNALRVTSGKTPSSIRAVPVHRDIQPLVHRLLESSRDGYLVSGLQPGAYDGKRSASMSKRFGVLKHELGFDDPGLVFHSFRGSFIRALAEAEVPKSLQRILVGHADGDITDTYAGGISMALRVKAVAKIRFGSVGQFLSQ